MFATSDWEPDVPKGNISFGKKPLKDKSQKKDITSTFQNVHINHDINRGFPINPSGIKPKKSKNKSNHKKSLTKSLQSHDAVSNGTAANKSQKHGMKNGSTKLTAKATKPEKITPQDSLENKKKEKKEKRAKEQNLKTENLKAVLNQFSNVEEDKESIVKTTSLNDNSEPIKSKDKGSKRNTPADNANSMNLSKVALYGANKKKKHKNLKEKVSKTTLVDSNNIGNDESSANTTPGCFVRNPNFNNQLNKTEESVDDDSTKTKRKAKKNNTNEPENDTVNKINESRKRKPESIEDNKKVQSKKSKPIKDILAEQNKDNAENSEEYNDFSAPEALGKKGKLKEKLKNMLNTAQRRPIATDGNKLRERMMEKLKSAQFRYLNEKLYTSSGSEAQQLFQSDPVAFQTYHEGYQQQVKKWPVNPIDVIAKLIMKMPKTTKIADMGCGEAVLSKRVPHSVRSFDLVAASPGVEACDMAHTPLLTGSMDVVVYCLALMGTDLTQYLVEANRVLKVGGLLYIAEVESRFDSPEAFTESVQRLGFKLLKLDKSHEVFFFMQFKKFQDPPSKKSKLPALSLKPCLYKRR